MARTNVSVDNQEKRLAWDDFAGKPVGEALPKIYECVDSFSLTLRTWYWSAIRAKRRMSFISRAISYTLVLVGVIAPLATAVVGEEYRLLCSQAGVIALAVAGLSQLCDKVFGWSSGWLRYISTVTALERLTRQFHLDWAGVLIAGSTLSESDKKPLFDLARQFEADLLKRQAEETDSWVAEFNSGMAALNEMIKTQKEATEKAASEARTAVDTRVKAAQAGTLEVGFAHAGAPAAVQLRLDAEDPLPFLGTSWVRADAKPGVHVLRLQRLGADEKPIGPELHRAIEVQPGVITRVEIDLRALDAPTDPAPRGGGPLPAPAPPA